MSATRCHHICRCGAELRCACQQDRCAAGIFWACPTCELAGFDTYISRLLDTEQDSHSHPPQTQETTRHGKSI